MSSNWELICVSVSLDSEGFLALFLAFSLAFLAAASSAALCLCHTSASSARNSAMHSFLCVTTPQFLHFWPLFLLISFLKKKCEAICELVPFYLFTCKKRRTHWALWCPRIRVRKKSLACSVLFFLNNNCLLLLLFIIWHFHHFYHNEKIRKFYDSFKNEKIIRLTFSLFFNINVWLFIVYCLFLFFVYLQS